MNRPLLQPGVPTTIAAIANDLRQGRASSAALVAECLARANDKAGEGARVFTRTYPDAVAAAGASDARRAAGSDPALPLAGIPISIKDLFDVAGETTWAGSRALADAPPAVADAPIVARLRAAGAVIVGKTNMTEFAYSALGINPHFGTPRNPWDRATGRVPGGSSSGAAISVTDAMAAAAIGTDTGGSVRIPAALCGLVGFKPTAARVPRAGAIPLSHTLDSIGPLAHSVACCALLDAVLAGEAPAPLPPVDLAAASFGVPQTLVLDELDPAVARAFARALSRLAAAGAKLVELPLPELAEAQALTARGGYAAAEAYAWHEALIARRGALYDPRVLVRIMRGKDLEPDYVTALSRARANLIDRVAPQIAALDGLLLPAVPVVAPAIAPVAADDAAYFAANSSILRNAHIVNFLDGCALSMPCHDQGDAPVGLMLMGLSGSDRRVLAVGAAIETCMAWGS
jgi:aspartyl-tRNA(Asn)/glutamyl-tRNA(Gln) amidotransferase subunit A